MREELTDLQKRAAEIAKKYESLPMRDKISIIAQTFGCTSGKIETFPCYGKWRGTSDMFITFDNGASLSLGNETTPQAKTVKVHNEYVNAVLARYNPEIVAMTKEIALAALRKRETKDSMIAAEKGLKPYTMLNVEFNDGSNAESGGYIGWYYVTLAVGGKICAHLESGLAHEIALGKVSETPARERYYIAGGVKEADVEYVFNNVGFSIDSYGLPISKDVLKRAEKALAERGAYVEHTRPRKPSLREQLAAARMALAERPAAQQRQKIMEAR